MAERLSPPFEVIANYGCEIGENPLWHPREKRLYWTDIPTGRLFRFDPSTETHEQIYLGRPVGGFTFEEDGGLLLFRDRGNVAVLRGAGTTDLIEEVAAERDSRFNDVIADPLGRVFCGTLPSSHSKGRLYKLDLDRTLTEVIDGVSCANGMGFTPDFRSFFFTDSFVRKIYRFDYHLEEGSLTNQRVFATIPESDGLPDGLTIDEDGNVWSALWDGGSIVRFDPDGNIDLRWSLPTPKTSSLAFGGDDLQDIYVTTAGGRVTENAVTGALLRIHTKLRGRQEFFSKISR